MPVEQLSLDLLRTFWVFTREGTVDLAAKKLHMTQAAVSIQLQRLEKQVGAPLFNVSGRRKVLTAFGKDLSQQLAPPLKHLESALSEVRVIRSRSHRPSLKVACPLGLAPLISTKVDYLVHVEQDNQPLKPALDLILSGDRDLLFYDQELQLPGKLVSKELWTSRLGIASSKEPQGSDLGPAFIHEHFLNHYLKLGFTQEPRAVVSDWIQCLHMTKKNLGWTILPFELAIDSGLSWRPIEDSSLNTLKIMAVCRAQDSELVFKSIKMNR